MVGFAVWKAMHEAVIMKLSELLFHFMPIRKDGI